MFSKAGRLGKSVIFSLAVCVPFLLNSSNALAEITEIEAEVSAVVQEYVSGEEGSLDGDYGTLGVTVLEPPLEVTAELSDVDTANNAHGAVGIASFDDPTLVDSENPQELGLEATCFSRADEYHYSVSAKAVETRAVVLDTTELDVDAEGDENLVTSTVFLSGAVMVWSELENPDLTELSADFAFVVTQDVGTSGSEVVFETSLSMVGDEEGELASTQAGSIVAYFEEPSEVLPAEVVDLLSGLGTVHLLVIPEQEISYAYFAKAGEAFTLTAEASLGSINIPGGTGVASVFGRPFEELGGSIASSLVGNEQAGTKIQDAVNAYIKAAELEGDGTGDDGDDMPGTAACGALGLISPILMVLGMFGLRCCSRRGIQE